MPSKYSTTTPSMRKSSPQTFSTSSASWQSLAQQTLPAARRGGLCPPSIRLPHLRCANHRPKLFRPAPRRGAPRPKCVIRALPAPAFASQRSNRTRSWLVFWVLRAREVSVPPAVHRSKTRARAEKNASYRAGLPTAPHPCPPCAQREQLRPPIQAQRPQLRDRLWHAHAAGRAFAGLNWLDIKSIAIHHEGNTNVE